MEGETIYLKVGKDIVRHIVEQFPEYKNLVTGDGTLFVKMLKTIYGCVQASLLWYKLLVQVLEGIGFKVSEVDRCVMRLIIDGVINIILIYVDDLLVFVTKAVVELILQTLKNRFTWLTVELEEVNFSYLGMQLILSEQSIVIDMQYYLQQILDNVSNLVRKAIPGGRESPLNLRVWIKKNQSGIILYCKASIFSKKSSSGYSHGSQFLVYKSDKAYRRRYEEAYVFARIFTCYKN
jgi:hypothetical protein